MPTSLAVPILTDEQRNLITDVRSPYSAEDRIACAVAYLVEGGNAESAAKKATMMIGQDVKAGTIRQWKARDIWWSEAETIARRILQQDLDRKYTRLLHLTEKELVERVLKGNSVLTKDGTVVRVPVPFRELVTGHGVISDKRAMLRGEPTSRKEDMGVELLLKLADALHKSGAEQLLKAPVTVDGEFEEIENVLV